METHRLNHFAVCIEFVILTGLVTATVASELSKTAQPALLYLVPFTILPLITRAYIKVGRSVVLSSNNKSNKEITFNR